MEKFQVQLVYVGGQLATPRTANRFAGAGDALNGKILCIESSKGLRRVLFRWASRGQWRRFQQIDALK